MIVSDKLDELCRLLAEFVPLIEARKRAGVSDKTYANWLEDKTIRMRIEAATRGALAPEIKDGDELSPDDCSAFGTGPMARLLWLDAKLVERMFPPISAWWREALTQFYASGKRWFVARVGRRGGKSSTLCRVAVAEAIWTERDLPPGTIEKRDILVDTENPDAKGIAMGLAILQVQERAKLLLFGKNDKPTWGQTDVDCEH